MDPSQTPSGSPPDGVTPNFVNPPSIGHIPRIGIYVLVPLMLVFVALRIGARLRLSRALGADDITCILAAACTIVSYGIILPYFGNPLGRHQWDVPLSDQTDKFLQAAVLFGVFSNLAIMFIKISLLLFYVRIFELFVWARVAIWSGLVANLTFYVTCSAVSLGLCIPHSGQIEMESTIPGDCLEAEVKTALAVAWFGTIIDLYILAIPVTLISTLISNKQRKIGVLAVFMTGSFACAASAVNLAQRYKLEVVYTDVTYNSVLFYLYGIIEVNVAIICSCMPLIAAPLKVMVARITLSWTWLRHETLARSPIKGATEDKPDNLVHNIPGARMSGLRTFARRFQRRNSQENPVVEDISALPTMDSFDEEYHQQVREIHRNNPARTAKPIASGTRGEGVYGDA